MKIRNFIFTIALIQPVLNSALSQSVPASSQSVPASSQNVPASSQSVPASSQNVPASSQSVPAPSQSVKVDIAPVISSGGTKTTTQGASSREVPPNIWFLIDDSSSMSIRMYYDPKTTYILPTDVDGNPSKMNKMSPWAQSRYCPRQVKNMANCTIWYYFYSTRLLTLKSSLANTFLKDNPSVKESQVRVGYNTITTAKKDWQGGYSNMFPVKPFDNASGKANKKAMKEWLYNLHTAGSTPTREAMSHLYAEIYNNAHAPVTAGAKT
ncbi:MAG: hypothetical protein ACWIPH_08145, partial [Ostreibacterium sp.]